MEKWSCCCRSRQSSPADEVLAEAYEDYKEQHALYGTVHRVTTKDAKAIHKKSATRSINSTFQIALLEVIKEEDKLKHLKELPEVVDNEAKYGVISTAASEFVVKLSSIALFIQMFTIIRSEVKSICRNRVRQACTTSFRVPG